MTEPAADTPDATPTTLPEPAAAAQAAEETSTTAAAVDVDAEVAADATAEEQDAPAQDPQALQDLPRPKWRFSGKRGRPVHERDAANKLPPEVREVVEQFVRTVEKDPSRQAAQHTSPAATPQPEEPQVVHHMPAASEEPVAAEEPAAPTSSEPVSDAEATVDAQPDTDVATPAAELDMPDPSAGSDESRLAIALIGQQPVLSLSDAERTVDEQPAIEAEPEATPAATTSEAAPIAIGEAPAETQTATEVRPAASPSPRPRSRRGSTKRRRNSLAWDRSPAKQPAATTAPSAPRPKREQAATAAPTPSRTPEAIARLDAPLHIERTSTNGLIEPRVSRRRSIARRAELDSALADLQTFVESSTSRR